MREGISNFAQPDFAKDRRQIELPAKRRFRAGSGFDTHERNFRLIAGILLLNYSHYSVPQSSREPRLRKG
jgi:hypothetical protein